MGVPGIGGIANLFTTVVHGGGSILGKIIDGIDSLRPQGEPLSVPLLNFTKIQELFQDLKAKNSQAISEAGIENFIGFTVAKDIDNRAEVIVIGIFNKKTVEVVDGINFTAESVDDEIVRLHRDSVVVLYD